MRYSVVWESVAGADIAVLRDAEADAEVRVAPALGNTCIGFRVGDWRVLDEPPNERELLTRASSYGIPILFPWPNRLREGRFRWEGREYRVPPSPGMAHANHGLVRNRPWRVKRFEADDEGALVESEILSTDFPELAEQYPSAFRLAVVYRLWETCPLQIDVEATNVGKGTLPFGFGLHPYFRVPLGPQGRRETCALTIRAANMYWELEDHLPTGRLLDATDRLDFEGWRALGDETYDDVLTDFDSGERVARLAECISRRHVSVGNDDESVREVVVFAPDDRPIVALEPYTCTTDALNLEAQGINAGLNVLRPGESWFSWFRIGAFNHCPFDCPGLDPAGPIRRF
jgi:aldose 1-epimerase